MLPTPKGRSASLFTQQRSYSILFSIYVMLFDYHLQYTNLGSHDPLSMPIRTLFTEEDWKLVQLVLTLFRNVLAIQEITLPQKASGEATHLLFLADSFLELMFQENVMDLILVLTQHIDEPSGYLKQENLLLMEIYHYLFLGRDPGLIARASSKDSKVFSSFCYFLFSFFQVHLCNLMPIFLSLIIEKKTHISLLH